MDIAHNMDIPHNTNISLKNRKVIKSRVTILNKPAGLSYLAYKKKNTIKRQRQRGGEKLGQGTFGCVLSPGIPCDQNKKYSAPTISKIIYEVATGKEDYNNELEISRKISHIDKKQRYLLSILDECPLNINNAIKRTPKDTIPVSFLDNELQDWQFIGPDKQLNNKLTKTELDTNYCLIDADLAPRNQIQVNGGIRLDTVKPTHNAKYYVLLKQFYLNVCKDLLTGVKMMHENRMVHRDIKESNMVIDIVQLKQGKKYHNYPLVRHIDFGLSETVEPTVDKGIYAVEYRGTPGFIPIEIIILYYMKNYYDSSYNLSLPTVKQNILSKIKVKYEEFKSIFVSRRITYNQLHMNSDDPSGKRSLPANHSEMDGEYVKPNEFSRLYDKMLVLIKNKTIYNKYTADFTGYLYKVDIFALGVTFAKLRDLLHIKNPKFMDLIKHMVMSEPDKRYNINQCLAHPIFK